MRNLLGQETFCQTMWSVSKLLPCQHVLSPHVGSVGKIKNTDATVYNSHKEL